MTVDFAREVVERHAPQLVNDQRFTVVDEDSRKWGYIIYGNDQVRIIVSVHHTGRDVSIRRTAPMRSVLDFSTPVDLYVHLERARPNWAGKLEGALGYLDAHLDDVLRVTDTEEVWDLFLADARAFLEATMGN